MTVNALYEAWSLFSSTLFSGYTMSGISVFSLKHNFKLSAYNTTYDIAAFAQSSKLKQINEKKY